MVSTHQSSDALLDRIGLHPNTLVELYRCMLLSRALDVRAWALSRQGRARFVITSRGHEAAQIGLAFALDRGRDWICPYYRDMALVLGIG
ncbi:MAG TPA: thiamine pyrophosphate-dependent enzyme, partial [Chloroflexota bacterium]|nr:thiamine pyrophosphate-dependent enzyme [Chloroflexota bacterium]